MFVTISCMWTLQMSTHPLRMSYTVAQRSYRLREINIKAHVALMMANMIIHIPNNVRGIWAKAEDQFFNKKQVIE